MIAFAGVDMDRLEARAAVEERILRAADEGTLTDDDLRRAAEDQLPAYSAAAVFLVTPPPAS